MKYYLWTIGCQMNFADSRQAAEEFGRMGFRQTDRPEAADLILLNTCVVRQSAEDKVVGRVTSLLGLKRQRPELRIILMGCFVNEIPALRKRYPWVDAFVKPSDVTAVVEFAQSLAEQDVGAMPREGAPLQSHPVVHTPAAVHASAGCPPVSTGVPISYGCDHLCTYCIVRLLRGPSRSRPPADVVAEVQALARAGCQEAVLTGVNLGAYGRDLDHAGGLRALIEALLRRTELPRLRLSSLEPWDVDEEFFQLWDDARLCRQLHLPLQSGCDETLCRMGRRIDTAAYAELVEAARAAVPDMAVSTDVIIGFPGEDDAAYRASYDFVATTEFARLHVFRYSPRPGTPAARLPNQIPRAVCNARAREMLGLAAGQALRFRQQFVGREMAVLWEQRRSDGLWTGLTDNYLRVVTQGHGDWHNRLTPTRLRAVQNGCLIGEIIEE